jgi:hypothetical protein
MENLAGHRHSDLKIERELRRSGIPVVKIVRKSYWKN